LIFQSEFGASFLVGNKAVAEAMEDASNRGEDYWVEFKLTGRE
jgi:hypothetical protein